jgi:hypothetical protein
MIDFETFRKLNSILEYHIQGDEPTAFHWDFLKNSGIISSYYKYRGKVWKVFFFYGDDDNTIEYKNCLKNGIETRRGQYVYSCTKNYNVLEEIKESLGQGYTYYIVVELESNKDTCFFDVNKLCKKLDIENPYNFEEEIVLFSDKVKIMKEDIIDYGKL